MTPDLSNDVRRVLVIDDDLDLLMLLERALQKQGFIIETAASLPEAEEIIPEFEPQVILLDINVDGADGRQLCWKLKNDPHFSSTSILLMSGYDCSRRLAHLFRADDIMPKPFFIDYLLQRITLLTGRVSG